jgi:hypothetical protein
MREILGQEGITAVKTLLKEHTHTHTHRERERLRERERERERKRERERELYWKTVKS